MSQVEWYYARGNKQSGPVSSLELKRLAGAGDLRPEDLVWREGMTEWSAARNVRGLFEEEGRGGAAVDAGSPAAKAAEGAALHTASSTGQSPGSFDLSPSRHLFDSLLDSLRMNFNARFLEATAKLFKTVGFYGLYAAMALAAAYDLIIAVNRKSGSGLLFMMATLAIFAALQYTAIKFCDALERLNRSTGSNLSSTAFPDCFALLCLAGGVVTLLATLAGAFQTSMYWMIFAGIVGFIVWGYLALVALNLPTLNISMAPEARAGEEAIGVLTFLLKAVLRLVPVAFGTGVALGAIVMGYACYLAFSEEKGLSILASAATGSIAQSIVIYSAGLPLAAYLVFLLYNLWLDLCRAVLAVPAKLDQLAEKGAEKKPEEKKAEEKKAE
jgi:hypothetical protein